MKGGGEVPPDPQLSSTGAPAAPGSSGVQVTWNPFQFSSSWGPCCVCVMGTGGWAQVQRDPEKNSLKAGNPAWCSYCAGRGCACGLSESRCRNSTAKQIRAFMRIKPRAFIQLQGACDPKGLSTTHRRCYHQCYEPFVKRTSNLSPSSI